MFTEKFTFCLLNTITEAELAKNNLRTDLFSAYTYFIINGYVFALGALNL